MTPEMVERVARAIEATMFAPHELPIEGELHERYRETARAAIEAMREPTEAMVKAGRIRTTLQMDNHAISGQIDRYASKGCWQKMIDAAGHGDA
jgi:hypothetical protein